MTLKNLALLIINLVLLLTVTPQVLAAPDNANKAENNPDVVAYYPTGIHAIAADPISYVTGSDLVMKRGNTGQIQQWFTGEDNHGIHSVWNTSNDGICQNNWVLIKKAYPSWGDYLTPDADYCVHNNTF